MSAPRRKPRATCSSVGCGTRRRKMWRVRSSLIDLAVLDSASTHPHRSESSDLAWAAPMHTAISPRPTRWPIPPSKRLLESCSPEISREAITVPPFHLHPPIVTIGVYPYSPTGVNRLAALLRFVEPDSVAAMAIRNGKPVRFHRIRFEEAGSGRPRCLTPSSLQLDGSG